MTVEELDAQQVPTVQNWPSVTVIVPVHGDRGEIAATARALAAQDYPGEFDVVVVDNGANRGLEQSLAALGSLQLLREDTPGSYAARNAALGVAGGEVLAFTDGDCLPRPDWLSSAVAKLLASDDPAFVGGAVELFPARAERPTPSELWDSLNFLRQENYVRDQGWAATANMVTFRSTFNVVGEFDQRLKSGGDRDWGERASRAGVKALYCAESVVRHPARPRMRELHLKARRVSRGDVELRRSRGMDMFDPGVLRVSLNPSPRSTVRRSGDLADPNPRNRAVYVGTALWMRYYTFGVKVSHIVRTSAPARALTKGLSR